MKAKVRHTLGFCLTRPLS